MEALEQPPQDKSKPITRTLDDVMDDIGFGKWQLGLLVVLAVGMMADGIEVTLLSFLSPCAGAQWGLNDNQMSIITSVVFVGELIGALTWGSLADHYGRRLIYGCSLVVMVVFGLWSAMATGFWSLVCLRALVGFGVGGSTVPFDMLAELVPAANRGTTLAVFQAFWGLGTLSVTALAWVLLDGYGWRWLVGLCALPSLGALMFVFLLPASPRWLLGKGRDLEAHKVLLEAARANEVQLGDFQLAPMDRQKEGSVSQLFSADMLLVTIVLVVLWFAYGLIYYSNTLVGTVLFQKGSRETKAQCSFYYPEIFAAACPEVIASLVLILVIDRLGRTRTMSCFFVADALAMVLLSLKVPLAALVIAAGFARGSGNIASSSVWIATPELYPTEIRTTSHSLLMCVARMGAVLSPFLVFSSLSLRDVTITLSAIALVAAASACFLPETSGVGLDCGLCNCSSRVPAGGVFFDRLHDYNSTLDDAEYEKPLLQEQQSPNTSYV